jgi:hypothetical protein
MVSFKIEPATITAFATPAVRIIDPMGVVTDEWRDTDAPVELSNGTYVMQFSELTGYKIPPAQSVTVHDMDAIVVVEYEVADTTHEVSFNTNVPNATMTIDNITKGTTSLVVLYDELILTLTEDEYNISFGAVSGFTTPPADEHFTLTADKRIEAIWS